MEALHAALRTAMSFPTVILTVPLVIAALYWFLSLFTGGDGGAMDGAAEGLAESLLDGAAESALEGVAEGALEGASDAAADSAAGGLADAGGGTVGRLVGCLGVGVVPVTLVLTSWLGFAWLSSLILTRVFDRHVDPATSGLLLGGGILMLALALGMAATAALVKPLKPLFGEGQIIRKSQLVGRDCVAATQRVDAAFGMAEVADGEAGLLIQVRSPVPLTATRGVSLRLVAYDAGEDVFTVHLMTTNSPDRASTTPKPADRPADPGSQAESPPTT